MSERICNECGERAVWSWLAGAPDVYLCDDHAADYDLDELEEL